MTDLDLVTISAGRGAVVRLRAGQHVRVINTHGTQCVDTWAFVADDVAEFLSMEHSRSTLEKVHFEVGDVLATNRYAPLYRNPNLAGVMKELGYVQRFGYGITLARNEMGKNGNPPPEFQVEDAHVAVIMRRHS